MNDGSKRLTIVARADGSYSFDLDAGGVVGRGGEGLDWGSVKNLIGHLAPVAGAAGGVAKGDPARHLEAAAALHRPAPPELQLLRLECARLMAQAGVPAERIITQATALSEWISQSRH